MSTDPARRLPPRRTWLRFRAGYVVILLAMAGFTLKFGEQAWANHEKALRVGAAAAVLHRETATIRDLNNRLKHAYSAAFIRDHAYYWGYVQRGERLVSTDFRPRRRPTRAGRPRPPARAPVPIWRQWWDAFSGGGG